MPSPFRLAALALPLLAAACAAAFTTAEIPAEERTRLATDGECRAATPGNRLPGFRCNGDYDSFD
ncbi:MAG: hypothetical protein AB7P02_24220 [Alphaproteobacteria bacterium]